MAHLCTTLHHSVRVPILSLHMGMVIDPGIFG